MTQASEITIRAASTKERLKAARLLAYATQDAFDKDIATKRKATLQECLHQTRREMEQSFCEQTDELWLAVNEADTALGVLWFRVEDLPWQQSREARLLGLVVHPKHRAKGLGSTLAQLFLEQSRAKKAALFRVSLRAENTAGLNLARKLGFFSEGFDLVARAGLSGPERRKLEAKKRKERA